MNLNEKKEVQEMKDQIAEAEAEGDIAQKAMLERILKNYVDVPNKDIEKKISDIKRK